MFWTKINHFWWNADHVFECISEWTLEYYDGYVVCHVSKSFKLYARVEDMKKKITKRHQRGMRNAVEYVLSQLSHGYDHGGIYIFERNYRCFGSPQTLLQFVGQTEQVAQCSPSATGESSTRAGAAAASFCNQVCVRRLTTGAFLFSQFSSYTFYNGQN